TMAISEVLQSLDLVLNIERSLLEILDLLGRILQTCSSDVLHGITSIEVHLTSKLNHLDTLVVGVVARVVDRIVRRLSVLISLLKILGMKFKVVHHRHANIAFQEKGSFDSCPGVCRSERRSVQLILIGDRG